MQPQLLQKILLVDDLRENLMALEGIITSGQVGPAVEIHRAQSARQALELLLVHDFALVLVDVQMPEMNGFDLAQAMRGTTRTRSIPIIFVTAGDRNREWQFTGYDAGAVDFLYKPLDPSIVQSKVRVFLELDYQKKLLAEQLERSEQARRDVELLAKDLRSAVRSRDDFLSIASHELKTPLTSLKLQAQMVKRIRDRGDHEAMTPERVHKFIDNVDRQVDRITRLVDDMLDISRIRAGKLTMFYELVDIGKIVNEVTDRLGPNLREAGTPATLSVQEGLHIMGDRLRLEQVITNLLTNAMRYGLHRSVEVRAERAEGSAALARVMVRDQGMGIAPENLERIFNRFERQVNASEVSGLGLGLFITRQIVDAHKGKIWVESAGLGHGSTFCVEFPIAEKNLASVTGDNRAPGSRAR